MKQDISKAPDGVRLTYTRRRYGNASLARGYIEGLLYGKATNWDVERYRPVYGLLAETIKASNDVVALREFCIAHADELRAEQEADRLWLAQREWAKGPSADEIAAKNQAAVAADKLEAEIQTRAQEIYNNRDNEAGQRAIAAARLEYSK